MKPRFANRMNNMKESFLGEILRVASNPQVISFAGGLPNPASFPIKELSEATQKMLAQDGVSALQYSTTEGYLPLRQMIADRYNKRFGIKADPSEILITNGSQQALDLIGKIFIDKGDDVLVERPGYLGAIEAISVYEPTFHSVTLLDDGIDVELLEKMLDKYNPKFFYSVPNFQNPSGLTYSLENRKKVAQVMKNRDTVFIEDDPYGELRFIGKDVPSMKTFIDDGIILLGSFSKIVSPGMRMGWIYAPKWIMDKLTAAKQAADLHTSFFTQRIVYQYLVDNDLDAHIEKIKLMYKAQRDCMAEMIDKYFPPEVKCTKPEGGMFMWATLPEGISSLKLFKLAMKENVAFVPGDPFYVNETDMNTLRLNYTNSDNKTIEEGIKRLGKAIKVLIDQTK